jgi:hypothetical protein
MFRVGSLARQSAVRPRCGCRRGQGSLGHGALASQTVASYLVEEGLAVYESGGAGIAITHDGIRRAHATEAEELIRRLRVRAKLYRTLLIVVSTIQVGFAAQVVMSLAVLPHYSLPLVWERCAAIWLGVGACGAAFLTKDWKRGIGIVLPVAMGVLLAIGVLWSISELGVQVPSPALVVSQEVRQKSTIRH